MRILFSILLSVTCFISNNAQSQGKIQVLDSITKEPVPYAIIIINDSLGLYSNEMGEFNKNKSGEFVRISSIGYYSKSLSLNDHLNRIYLKPLSYLINEVVIRPKKYKTKKLGYLNEKSHIKLYQAFKCGTELAVLIKNPIGKEAFINKVFMNVGINARDIESFNLQFVSIFKINIYSVVENQKVGDLINRTPLVYTSNELKKKTIIDISKQNIKMPIDGVFISIEWVGIEDKINKEIKMTENSIEPFIGLTSKSDAIVYKRNILVSNKWKVNNEQDKIQKKLGIENFVPQISAEFSY